MIMLDKLLLLIITSSIVIRSGQSQQFPLERGPFTPRTHDKDFYRRLLKEIADHSDVVDALRRKLAVASTNGNVSECDISLAIFAADIAKGEDYAIRMVDSWGKLESGIATGNVQWPGRYFECVKSHASQFSGKYFLIKYGRTPVRSAMCLPSTCTTEDAEQVPYPLATLFNIEVEAYHPVQPTAYTWVDIFAIVILSCLGCLLIAGTVYELYLSRSSTFDEDREHFAEDSDAKKRSQVISDLVLSFSMIENTKMIFDTTRKEGNIHVLHGLRFVTMTWIILGHLAELASVYIDNGIDAARYYITHWTMQVIGNGYYAVDTFFFMSGLLASLIGLREMRKRNGKLSVLKAYVYRYIRLTPPYALCLLVVASLYSKFGDGPYWPQTAEGMRAPCQKYWWTNMLYINNMYPILIEDSCFGWGWFLANDMQFFLVMPFLLLLIYKRPVIGASASGFLVLLCMVANGVITSHYNLQPAAILWSLYFYPFVFGTSSGDESSQLDYYSQDSLASDTQINSTTAIPETTGTSTVDMFFADTYSRPWCRMGAYFIGVLTGILFYYKGTRIHMNKKVAAVGWTISAATALTLIYGIFGHVKNSEPLPTNVAAFYDSLVRSLWATCMMWVVVACTAGYGGPINIFLSWGAFTALGRLTFCAYLVHPPVTSYLLGTLETRIHASFQAIAVVTAAVTVFSYVLAYILAILIEVPTSRISKILLRRSGRKKSNIQLQKAEESKL